MTGVAESHLLVLVYHGTCALHANDWHNKARRLTATFARWPAGDEKVVEGLDLAVLKANAKETVEVTVAPEYGYVDAEHRGSVGVVPPNSTLHYTFELLEVQKVHCQPSRAPDNQLGPQDHQYLVCLVKSDGLCNRSSRHGCCMRLARRPCFHACVKARICCVSQLYQTSGRATLGCCD